jgi:hypothetical protein
MEADSKQPLCVAIDTEGAGDTLAHNVIQIGLAIGTNLQDMKKWYVCIKPDCEFGDRCLKEFWEANDENKATLKRILAVAVEPTVAWDMFNKKLDALEKASDDLRWVSDNPSYDIGRIDYNLFTRSPPMHTKRPFRELPIRYTRAGKYRTVSDPSEQIKGLPKAIQAEIRSRLAKEFPHTHWAPDDAAQILAMYFMVKEAREKQEKVAI